MVESGCGCEPRRPARRRAMFGGRTRTYIPARLDGDFHPRPIGRPVNRPIENGLCNRSQLQPEFRLLLFDDAMVKDVVQQGEEYFCHFSATLKSGRGVSSTVRLTLVCDPSMVKELRRGLPLFCALAPNDFPSGSGYCIPMPTLC
jgi:hypothetical protein